ncbi:hypothetical protein ACJRO7_029595 [Eucalyptus globulus]|uniref:RNase H type-1 domain-containing protein n=1 Tax=Eucalyptus globulus TaxID=34317 RepID=A0ABD3JBL3_EUCGL
MDKWVAEYLLAKTQASDPELVVEVLWQIWKNRNNFIFRKTHGQPQALIDIALAQNSASQRWVPRNSSRLKDNEYSPVTWKAPKTPDLKLNVDSSWIATDSACSVAGLLRDSNGSVIDGFAKEVHAASPLQAETIALFHGLKMLEEWKTTHVEQTQELNRTLTCESDSRKLVDFILGREEASWAIQLQVQECKIILAQLPSATVSFCLREANHAVDWVAKAFRKKTLPSNWQRKPLAPLMSILCYDSNLSCKARCV